MTRRQAEPRCCCHCFIDRSRCASSWPLLRLRRRRRCTAAAGRGLAVLLLSLLFFSCPSCAGLLFAAPLALLYSWAMDERLPTHMLEREKAASRNYYNRACWRALNFFLLFTATTYTGGRKGASSRAQGLQDLGVPPLPSPLPLPALGESVNDHVAAAFPPALHTGGCGRSPSTADWHCFASSCPPPAQPIR